MKDKQHMRKKLALLGTLPLLLISSASAQMGTNTWSGWTNSSWPTWTNNVAGWTNQSLPVWTNNIAWWTNFSQFTNGHVAGSWTNHGRFVRPPRGDRPDRPALPADVEAWISKFEASRAEWVKNNPAGATMPDRDAILTQIEALRSTWRDQSSMSREQWLEQMQGMKDRFQNLRDRVLDGSGHGAPGTRDR